VNAFDVSAALLVGFAILSFVDGVYLHLYKFRLHARATSRAEHLVHSARALLFVPTLLLVLSGTSSGALLWLGVAVVAADAAVTVADVVLERGSRGFQGGVPGYETALHVVLTAFHGGAIALSLWARPAEAWWQSTSAHLADAARARALALDVLLGGAVIVALAHLALMHPRLRSHPRWGVPVAASA
jgi:hypothetical protein